MTNRLTAEQIEELERLRDDRASADPDRYIGAGTRFQLALDNYSDALLAAARENAALRRECKALRYPGGAQHRYGCRCVYCEEVLNARAETDRLGALEVE